MTDDPVYSVTEDGRVTSGKRDLTTSIFSIKCTSAFGGCGLEFQVFSWNPNWTGEHEVFCPECGRQGHTIVLKVVQSEKFIFEFVT